MSFGVRELVLLAVLVAMPVASFFLVFKPQNEAIASARAEIEHREGLLQRHREETARTSNIREENERLEAEIGSLEDMLPGNKELSAVIRQVSNIAVRAGLSAPDMETNEPIRAALYWEQPLKMKTTGEFLDFVEFVRSLENLPRLTRIPDLKLQRRKVDEPLEIEFTLSIYFMREEGGR